jgi:hypothetical protein
MTTGGSDAATGIPINHPGIFVKLKGLASVSNFKFVVNGSYSTCGWGFPDQLFKPTSQGGQGYGTNPDVFGWQFEDEPLWWAAIAGVESCYSSNPQGCNAANMDSALDRVRDKFNTWNFLGGVPNPQVLFDVEASIDGFNGILQCDPESRWDESLRVGDAANHDSYPGCCTPMTPLNITSTRGIADSVSRQTTALSQQKPSWFTTQAFSYGSNGFPTDAQSSATVFTAIVHGATGVWYYVWDSYGIRSAFGVGLVGVRPTVPTTYPENSAAPVPTLAIRNRAVNLWNGIASLNANLAQLEYVILAPTSTLKYLLSVDHPGQLNGPPPVPPTSPVHTMLKSVAGDAQYLLAVNMNNFTTTFKFEPLGMEIDTGQTTTWAYPGGAQPVVETPTYIQDELGPFETKVYRIVYNLVDPPPVPPVPPAPTCTLQPPIKCDRPPSAADIDGDGCPASATDVVPSLAGDQPGGERTTTASRGGKRDEYNRYDYFNPTQDGLNRVDDILAVVNQYFMDDPPGNVDYDSLTDRTAAPGGDPWDLTAPNGQQRVDDILNSIKQYVHDCWVS